MNASKRSWFVAITLFSTIALFPSQRSAEAGYIANNLGTNATYNSSSGYTLSGPKSSSGLGYNLAVEFQITGTSSIAFGSAQLALEYHSGANALTVLLMADNNGLPGTTLETMQVSNIAAGPTLVTATSTVNTMLNAGTNYWLVAVASNDTYMSWMANSQGSMNHLAYQTNNGSGPTPWSASSGNPDPAFAINAMVPAPPAVLLLGIGMASMAGFKTARRRFSMV